MPKTLQSIRNKALEEFEEKYSTNIDWGIEHSAGDYGIDMPGWEDMTKWLSEKIEEVVREVIKSAILDNKPLSWTNGRINDYDIGYREAFDRIKRSADEFLK